MRVQRTSVANKDPDAHARWLEIISTVLSGNTSFGSSMSNTDDSANMNCWKATGTAPAGANTEFAITHDLGRIPLTIGGQDTSNGGLLYRGTTAWTSTTVYLKCTMANSHYNVVLI